MYNTGLQANSALANLGLSSTTGWRGDLIGILGSGYDPQSLWANVIHGSLYFLPLLILSYTVGGFWEGLFAMTRGHEINEGFLVTGMLLPLTLPPAIPLWQVAVAISFGVVIGKEIFGGTGKNLVRNTAKSRRVMRLAAHRL